MYPLHMHKPAPEVGFALANDESEHASLTAAGFVPPLAAPQSTGHQVVSSGLPASEGAASLEAVRAELDARGISYDKRWGLARLKALL